MSESGKDRIIVCGDVNGKFNILFAKLENLKKKKGPFSSVLCVGNFFGTSSNSCKLWEPFASGTVRVPIPMYVLGGSNENHIGYFKKFINNGQIAPNVTYLGKRGVIRTVTGLKIAYVSGVESDKGVDENVTFTLSDVKHVRDMCVAGQPSYVGIDFLLTTSWPSNVTNFDPHAIKNAPAGSHMLSWLAVQLKPRYHITSMENSFYERPPYSNVDSSGIGSVHATRFMALASVGNKANEKWLSGLSVTPIDIMKQSELYQLTTDLTTLPYSDAALSAHYSEPSGSAQQFFYDMSTPHEGGMKRKHDGSHKKSRTAPVFDTDKCWFCLASPDVEKHLIVSVGTEVYLALAKGPLTSDHLLILTVGHYQSLVCLPENIVTEVERFKSHLRKYFKSVDKVPVFFERNYKTSHLQIQVIPVPKNKSGNLSIIFQEQAENDGFELEEIPENSDLAQIVKPGTPYFYLELPNCKFFCRPSKNFPIQFGREVIASDKILDMEERADWRSCKMSKKEESESCQQFRKQFEPFDFTLE